MGAIMKNTSAFDEGVTAAGGMARLAEALGEKSIQVVSNWRGRGVPISKCKAFEAITGVSVRRLRPHDWRKFWPDAPPPAPKRKRATAAA